MEYYGVWKQNIVAILLELRRELNPAAKCICIHWTQLRPVPKYRSQEYMDLYIHFPSRLHGVVLN
jgi:hypothetical protein